MKVVKFELGDSGWVKQTVKGNLSPKAAKEESDRLNDSRDNQEQTVMVCYAVEK
jgi:hypothetical protein